VSVIEPSNAVKRRTALQKGERRLELRTTLCLQLALWLGLDGRSRECFGVMRGGVSFWGLGQRLES